jgi:hypothetical protein
MPRFQLADAAIWTKRKTIIARERRASPAASEELQPLPVHRPDNEQRGLRTGHCERRALAQEKRWRSCWAGYRDFFRRRFPLIPSTIIAIPSPTT